jgi:hypothetical protein
VRSHILVSHNGKVVIEETKDELLKTLVTKGFENKTQIKEKSK